jgi:hypothetical protein
MAGMPLAAEIQASPNLGKLRFPSFRELPLVKMLQKNNRFTTWPESLAPCTMLTATACFIAQRSESCHLRLPRRSTSGQKTVRRNLRWPALAAVAE